eukprot:EG_transcript_12598
MTKWGTIACDQYTSDPAYWQRVEDFVGADPSAYKLILPEVFLETEKEEEVIANVKRTMQEYKEQQILVAQQPGFVLVDRKTPVVPSRKGLMVALDLEHYSYEKGSTTLMRATEGTILSRLPPRVRVREAASIELPHIMVLIDDPEKTIIEPLFAKNLKKVYDFDLMANSGHLTGYAVDAPEDIEHVVRGLSTLVNLEAYAKKYSVPVPEKTDVLLYAMGDGNHSFATAKLHWERTKEKAEDKEAVLKTHPARYCLVELVNIHDDGLEFEGIHRVVFNVNTDDLFGKLTAFFASKGSSAVTEAAVGVAEAVKAAEASNDKQHKIAYVGPTGAGIVSITNPHKNLETAGLQEFLDEYLAGNKEAKIDYIHGVEATASLAAKEGNIGFFCPTISKHTFFRTIIKDGAFPRKTFSMGEADEKRFYVEARAIV